MVCLPEWVLDICWKSGLFIARLISSLLAQAYLETGRQAILL